MRLPFNLKYIALVVCTVFSGIGFSDDKFLYYYDGNQKHPIYQKTNQFLTFSGDTRHIDGAIFNKKMGNATLWIIHSKGAMDKVKSTTKQIGVTGSEVFSDTLNGRPRAIQQGVIIRFPIQMNLSEQQNWLLNQGLNAEPLVARKNIWMVSSPPGIEGLMLANKLHETGKVEATPNWWQHSVAK